MPISLGNILGGLGTAVAGPIGGLIGSVGGALIDRNQAKVAAKRAAQMSTVEVPATSTVPTPAATALSEPFVGGGNNIQVAGLFPRLPTPRLPAPRVSRTIAGAGGGIADILARARANSGMRITGKKIVSLIRQFGWATVGGWLGLEVAELMEVWQHQTRRRRRRWTRKDLQRGRAYIRHLERAEKELNSLRPRARRSTASRSRSGKSSIVNVK